MIYYKLCILTASAIPMWLMKDAWKTQNSVAKANRSKFIPNFKYNMKKPNVRMIFG